ncbi:MAG TPA: response regulator [Candidatus Hydrogenedentes bacterium]|nr:response regulator [Candidatus Hydrogenedentota bacterium]HPG68218.1 response regulator [Candidatus Hydrogenedentota bacterium]
MDSRVFTSGEVASICGVSADTVSRWFDLGQIEGYRLGPGGDRRIPYESLRKFMLAHGIPLDRLEEGRKRVLVVDDDPYYLDRISDLLAQEEDLEVMVASTGFDAGAAIAEHNPHLVILDIHLSDIDGRQVCQRVKTRPETTGTRVLAISSFLDEDEERELGEYGFDGYLQKPFTGPELTEQVRRLFSMAAPRQPAKGRGV